MKILHFFSNPSPHLPPEISSFFSILLYTESGAAICCTFSTPDKKTKKIRLARAFAVSVAERFLLRIFFFSFLIFSPTLRNRSPNIPVRHTYVYINIVVRDKPRSADERGRQTSSLSAEYKHELFALSPPLTFPLYAYTIKRTCTRNAHCTRPRRMAAGHPCATQRQSVDSIRLSAKKNRFFSVTHCIRIVAINTEHTVRRGPSADFRYAFRRVNLCRENVRVSRHYIAYSAVLLSSVRQDDGRYNVDGEWGWERGRRQVNRPVSAPPDGPS